MLPLVPLFFCFSLEAVFPGSFSKRLFYAFRGIRFHNNCSVALFVYGFAFEAWYERSVECQRCPNHAVLDLAPPYLTQYRRKRYGIGYGRLSFLRKRVRIRQVFVRQMVWIFLRLPQANLLDVLTTVLNESLLDRPRTVLSLTPLGRTKACAIVLARTSFRLASTSISERSLMDHETCQALLKVLF